MIDKNSNQPAAEGTFIFEPRNVIDSYPQAVLQKLARIVFRLLSTGEPYDESVFHKCEEEALKRAEMRPPAPGCSPRIQNRSGRGELIVPWASASVYKSRLLSEMRTIRPCAAFPIADSRSEHELTTLDERIGDSALIENLLRVNVEIERLRILSNAELSQMMIEVLISHNGPLDRRHGTEKAVRMGRALSWSSRRKPVNPVDQTSLLFGELPLIVPD